MAIKCHSSFVHYNMFHNHHCHGGGNNYGSIFNIQHNCGGGTNFWGGLGAGIGYGLGGMFSGLFGGFGNMFGGFGNMFGMGNMFGGFGGFGLGGFGGFASSLGTYFGYELAEGLDGLFSRKDKDRTKINKKDKDDDVKKDDDANKDVKPEDDKDYEKINKLVEEGDKLIGEAKKTDKTAEIDALLNQIDEKYKKDDKFKFEDEISTSENEKQLNLLIERLKSAKATEAEADSKGPKVTINGNDILLANLTSEDIEALSKEQIDGLQVEQAKALLEKLNLLCKDNSGRDGVQATTSLNALRLAEKAKLPVALAHNKALDNKIGAKVDPYLDGTVSNIEYNETTQIITYHLEDENGIYEVECTAGSTEIKTLKLINNKTQKYTSFTPATYEIKTDDSDPYAVRDELPASVS